MVRVNRWLTPLSFLYGLGVTVRNMLFEKHILPSVSFPFPVICIGNLTVGGTGKTPHTEYLIRLLHDSFHLAVLSRGYKRKSSGFVLADKNTNAARIGDEPYQMKQKFPDVLVAVDVNRCHGIRTLMDTHHPDVILLDDAYQHRYVKPGLTLLLTDYNRLISEDSLLPAGRLREPFREKGRAQVVIVTKCPSDMKPIDYRITKNRLRLYPFQQLFFTTQTYPPLRRMTGHGQRAFDTLTSTSSILLITGIATPQHLFLHFQSATTHITALTFPDHHDFSAADIQRINAAFASLQGPDPLVVTTEKDAARLVGCKALNRTLRSKLYVQPLEISFLQNKGNKFNTIIQNYVRKNI